MGFVVAIASAGTACNTVSGVDDLSIGAVACAGSCVELLADAAPGVPIGRSSDGSACACVGAVPPGWRGPASLWEGRGAAPDCSGAYPTNALDAFRDPDAPAATCGCECGAPTGALCPETLDIDVYGAAVCGAQHKCDTITLSLGVCANVPGGCLGQAVSGVPIAMGGSCAPAPLAVVPPSSWRVSARACASAGPVEKGTCEGAQLCVPLPGAPMAPRPCIFRAGDVACPAADFTAKHVVYAAADDTRRCTPCTCGPPAGAVCNATVARGCGGTDGVSLPASCAALSNAFQVELVDAGVPSGGACAAAGGAPDGALVPTSPTTLCCVP